MSARPEALLVLEDGSVFRGTGYGAEGETFGEVVFNTALTGYQEILTDPSYCGQIVVMTAPQIGNTGVNDEDFEADGPACAGFAVREASQVVSSWRADDALDAFLAERGIVGIEGIDTRRLTRALRERGAMRGAISTTARDPEELIARVKAQPSMEGLNLVPRVTCREAYTWDEPGWIAPDLRGTVPGPRKVEHHVVAYDFGIKRNILRDLRSVGCRVSVVPAGTRAKDALALGPDGIFLSNGPGDPAAVTDGIAAVRDLLDANVPMFGICLGHQILSLAVGGRTFKLPFGHHGGNHPVKDLSTGKVEITSQNHGFATDPASLEGRAEVTHINLYDDTVEGIRVPGKPIFSVQYHPEASPGPHDASYLFGRFLAAMRER